MRPASVSGDSRRYTIKASELHLPIALIRWVGTPAQVAAMAAPILKLCPVYPSAFTPPEDKAAQTPAMKVRPRNRRFVRGNKEGPWACRSYAQVVPESCDGAEGTPGKAQEDISARPTRVSLGEAKVDPSPDR